MKVEGDMKKVSLERDQLIGQLEKSQEMLVTFQKEMQQSEACLEDCSSLTCKGRNVLKLSNKYTSFFRRLVLQLVNPRVSNHSRRSKRHPVIITIMVVMVMLNRFSADPNN